MTVAAIHQPTFLPWLGWWDKFVRADVFVLLDDVQFPKTGGTWVNRVRMLVNGNPAWVTAAVDRSFHGVLSVREIRVDDRTPWRDRAMRTIAENYRDAPHFHDVYPVVEDIVRKPVDRIAELNEHGIRRLAASLGVDAGKLVRQSELGANGRATELLVSLCKAVGATTYLTGDGAGGYLEPQKFAAAGLELVEQRFVSPQYPQIGGRDLPGLSIVDALMSCGWGDTASLLARTARY